MDSNEIISLANKSWYKSKTVWFNILTIVTFVATYYGYTPNQELANHLSNILVFASPIVNIALRKITKTKI